MQTLDKLAAGQRATVKAVTGEGSAIYQRLLEMGVFEGAQIEVVRLAPLGDPMELRLHGYNLSVRKSEAACVQITEVQV
jgi:Fe2+ transport system protein FeoA